MESGRAATSRQCSAFDYADGGRDRRADGGVVIVWAAHVPLTEASATPDHLGRLHDYDNDHA
jgi:hypothetical protein